MNNESEKELTRRGFPLFLTNPSLNDVLPVRVKPKQSRNLGDAYMIAPGTGEVVAKGAFAFVEEKEVDSEQFVKVYLEGIKQYGQLNKAGAMLFELVYREMSGHNGKDRDIITLNLQLASIWKPNLTRTTFFRGMKELLEKGFLFRSISADDYFVNIKFIFNGDRMVLVKDFKRKKEPKKLK